MFGRHNAPALAAVEQERGDGLTARIVEIQADPNHPSTGSLPLYRMAAQDAFTNAADAEPQPKRGWRK